MFLDNELSLVTATAFDLGSVAGPGKPIKGIALGVSTTVTITTGATDDGADNAMMVVTCGGADLVEFELPSSCQQWITPTFADGAVELVLEGNQTAV